MTDLVVVPQPGDPHARRPLTCHHCGSASLSLIEHVAHTSEWEGVDLVDGVIRPRSEVAYHRPGYPICKPTIHCYGCDRTWTPRRPIEFQ